jgi:hypothetical protein
MPQWAGPRRRPDNRQIAVPLQWEVLSHFPESELGDSPDGNPSVTGYGATREADRLRVMGPPKYPNHTFALARRRARLTSQSGQG